MAEPSLKSLFESVPYPSQPMLKSLSRSPLFLWRMGLGPLVGQLFMVVTTTGRKSGLPRRAVIEFHERNGRKYAVAGWPQSDWYQNIQADPCVTLQTASGTEQAIARRLTDDAELDEAWRVYVEQSRSTQSILKSIGLTLTRESFITYKDAFHVLTFDPTDEATPPPLEVDLLWVWPVLLAGVLVGLLTGRRGGRKR